MSETRDLIISNMIGNPEKAADAFIGLQKEFSLLQKQLEQQAKSIDELSRVVIELSDWIENSTCFDNEYDLTKVRAITNKFKTNKQDK